MAKMNDDKAAMYLVAIVGVVAAVGIVVLLMGAGVSVLNTDVSGQAVGGKLILKKGFTKPTSSEEGCTGDNCSHCCYQNNCVACQYESVTTY